jgi:hypothetical protein
LAAVGAAVESTVYEADGAVDDNVDSDEDAVNE